MIPHENSSKMERLPGTLLAIGRITKRDMQEDEEDLNFYCVTTRKGEREVTGTKGK